MVSFAYAGQKEKKSQKRKHRNTEQEAEGPPPRNSKGELPSGEPVEQLTPVAQTPDSLDFVLRPVEKKHFSALQELSPAELDGLIQQVRTDDELVNYASAKGLLMTFRISTMAMELPVIVHVPEFATVKFLKRRIFREKLVDGDLIWIDKFQLRYLSHENDTTTILQEKGPQTLEKLLIDYGFCRGGDYELRLKSQYSNNDEEQQQRMLEESVNARSTLAFCNVPLSDNPKIRERQEKLMQGAASVPPTSPLRAVQSPSSRHTSVHNSPTQYGRVPSQLPILSMDMVDNLDDPAPLMEITESQEKKKGGSWNVKEVAYLIRGIKKHGTASWSKIAGEYSGKGIDPRRTTVDYKDKWRNIVRAVNKECPARQFHLSEDVIQWIRSLP